MSDSLFLPRELFQAEPVRAASPAPAFVAPARPRRSIVQFMSGADVAADLLQAMNAAPEFVERRRRPRTPQPLR